MHGSARFTVNVHGNAELYAVAPRRVRKMISHDWGAGFVSPFRPTDEQRADEIMACTGACICLPPPSLSAPRAHASQPFIARVRCWPQASLTAAWWWISAPATASCSLLLPSAGHTPSAMSSPGFPPSLLKSRGRA
jgi:hypothetical protein